MSIAYPKIRKEPRLVQPLKIEPVVHYATVAALGQNSGNRWPRRRFVDYQMLLMIAGAMRFELHERGEDFTLRPGEVATISPGELNSQTLLSPVRKSSFACVHFLVSPAAGARAALKPPRVAKGLNLELYRDLFQRLFDAFRAPGRYSMALASGITREIYLRLLEPGDAVDGARSRIREMTEFLDSRLLSRPGREELAKKFKLNPEYVNQFFRRNLGVSPGEYVRKRLSQEGYRLLSRERLSVKECAARLGFKNQFHFSKVFRREYEMAPSALRHN